MTDKKPKQISIETAMHIASGEYLTDRLPMESFEGVGWDDMQVNTFIIENVIAAHEGTTVNDIWESIDTLAGIIRDVSLASIRGDYHEV